MAAFAALSTSGQITLEHSYPNHNSLQVFKLESVGHVFVGADLTARKVIVYNPNHSIYKILDPSLNLPPSGSFTVYWLSEKLFDSDGEIEYVISYTDPSSTPSSYTKVFNEDGAVIKVINDAAYSTVVNLNGDYKLIAHVFRNSVQSVEVYDVPGTYITGLKAVDPGAAESVLYPNPVTSLSKLQYTLPAGVTTGEIAIYSLAGVLIKNYQVTNAFNDILISRSDLPSGHYTYVIKAAGYASEAESFIVQ